MDVRCDRCQTEYELDDESVAGAGASVQCTTCGHTFVVTRSGSMTIGTSPTPPGGIAAPEPSPSPGPGPRPSQTGSTPPPAPEWVLATEEGQTHRLRDLTTLQKWIVERRVSRVDRVSQRGGAWRPLGELDELRPFFDVVEQADRQTGGARAAEPVRSVRPTMPATPRKMQSPVRSHVSADLDDDDVFSSSSSRGRGDAARLIDSDIGSDDDLSLALRPRRTGLKIVGVLAFAGLAAAAWYLGFRDPHGFRIASGAPIAEPAPAAAPVAVVPAPAPAPDAAPAPAPAPAPTSTAEVPPPAPAGPPTPAAVAPAPAPAPVAAAAAAPPVPEKVAATPAATPAEPAKAATASSHASADADSKPRSYERLVEDADHALENGQTAKAQKMYDEALRLQPNGVAAQTGSAYLLMDKRRPLAAIGLFKQALSYAPNYAPALFGLGEAYRSQGNAAEAIDAYKRYLEQSPAGTDAPAARRQIKDLGEAAAAPRNAGPSAVVPDNAEIAAPSATTPPPTTPPPLN